MGAKMKEELEAYNLALLEAEKIRQEDITAAYQKRDCAITTANEVCNEAVLSAWNNYFDAQETARANKEGEK